MSLLFGPNIDKEPHKSSNEKKNDADDPDLAFALMDLRDLRRQWNPNFEEESQPEVESKEPSPFTSNSKERVKRISLSDEEDENNNDEDMMATSARNILSSPNEKLISSDRNLSQTEQSASDTDEEEVASEEFIRKKEQQIEAAAKQRASKLAGVFDKHDQDDQQEDQPIHRQEICK